MCEQERQCCAPSKGNERCTNTIVCGSRFHCETHSGPARKLYREYKVACASADKCDLTWAFAAGETAKEITHFNECYKAFIKAYNGRMAHRKYGFCSETWDEGHQTQFRLLKTRIELCEKRLDELYVRQKREFQAKELERKQVIAPTNEEEETSSDESKVDSKSSAASCRASFRNVQKFRRQRAADNAEVDRVLQKYIKQNETLISERKKVFDLAYNVLHSFIPPRSDDEEEDEDESEESRSKRLQLLNSVREEDDYDSEEDDRNLEEYLQVAGAYRMVRKLYEIGYLVADYVPNSCNNCKCGQFIPEYIKLSCRCIFNYSCLGLYLKRMKVESLKLMTSLLLKFRSKIQPLVDDYLAALDDYGPKALIMKSKLEWCPALKRLEFSEDFDRADGITSKYLSQFRKRGYVETRKSERSSSKVAAAIRSKSTISTALVTVPSSFERLTDAKT
jgi:hypothetical protein